MLRTRLLAVAGAAGVLLAAPMLTAGPATAATGYINVVANTVDSPPANPGLLSVTLASDMPVTAMTVNIVPMGGGAALLSLPLSGFSTPAQDGTGANGTWTLTSPITTGQLALGGYDVQVTATSADAEVTNGAAGTLHFLNEVTFPGFAASSTAIHQAGQDVTFTGTAMVTAPGGSPEPFGNKPVNLDETGPERFPVTTAADGTFSVTVPGASASFWMAYGGDAATDTAVSPDIQVSVTDVPVTLTASFTQPHVNFGAPDQVMGTLSYSSGGTTTPLAGITVSLYFLTTGNEQIVTATAVTDANGKFTMPAATDEGSATFYVTSQATQTFASATVAIALTVANPNFITGLRGTLNAFGVVTISGCVGASTGTVNIQYAAKAGGPWHALGRWKPVQGTSCAHGSGYGAEYSTSYNARLGSAYYRAVYTANYNSQGATSKTVHLARSFTKITSFKVSPRSVARHGKFDVSGRLWAQGKHGKWTPYAHKRLLIIFRYRGVYYRYAAEPKTNASGRFSGRFPIYVTAPLFAQYNGDSTHFASATARITVRLRRAAALTPNAAGLSGLRIARVLEIFRGLA